MKFAFIAAKEVAFPVSAIYRILGVSSSGYYAWGSHAAPPRVKADLLLAIEIAAAHKGGHKAYGSPRVHRELRSWHSRRPQAGGTVDAPERHPGPTKAAIPPHHRLEPSATDRAERR